VTKDRKMIESQGKNVCVGVIHGKMRVFYGKIIGNLGLSVSKDRKMIESHGKGKIEVSVFVCMEKYIDGVVYMCDVKFNR
jgi:hypothetical protein